MRILKIANIPDNPDTGMGRVMHATTHALRAMGHCVELMLSDDVPRGKLGRFDRFGFPIALTREVRRRLRAGETFDIVEIHEPSAAWYCFWRRFDKTLPPCAVMSHGLEAVQWRLKLRLDNRLGQKTSRKSRISVPLTLLSQARYALRHGQVVMCLNAMDERFLRRNLRLPANRVARVKHGVDVRFFTPRAEAEPVATPHVSTPRVLFVGSWLDKKGRHTLAHAFGKWRQKRPDLRLSLVGTGIEDEAVASFFEPFLRPFLDIKAHVGDDELCEVYASHQIFAFPTWFEPWGLVLLEAAAAGMAIVSTQAGGPADFFVNGETALLVPPGDDTTFAAAVEKLLDDPLLCAQLGQAARERARDFTWHGAAQSHLRAYERALALED